ALIDLDQAREQIAYLQEYRAQRGVTRPLEVVMPLGNWIRAPMVKSPAPDPVDDPRYRSMNNAEQPGDAGALIERLGRYAEAGITGVWVTFIYQELGELLDSLAWFAEEVKAK